MSKNVYNLEFRVHSCLYSLGIGNKKRLSLKSNTSKKQYSIEAVSLFRIYITT